MSEKTILKNAIKQATKNGWGKGVDLQKLFWTISHDVQFISYR